MYKFEGIIDGELLDIVKNKKECHIEVSESLVGFSQLTCVDFSSPREVPPTPMVFFKEHFTQIVIHTRNDLKGTWDRFVLFVYAAGGKIFFKKISEDSYDAHVVWH